MRLLLVEDDPLLGDGVRAGLADAGFAVDWVKDGEAARAALEGDDYAAVVLDLGLPRLDGMDVLRGLRRRERSVPVLILTARDTVPERVAGLNAGADDYLVKPFDLDELIARLHAIVRRAGGRAAPLLRHGSLTLDPAARAVTWAGVPVELSPREFDLLLELVGHAGYVLSRERLEERLYGWGAEVESNAVEVHVHHLRKKLAPDFIRTVRGVGYVVEKAP